MRTHGMNSTHLLSQSYPPFEQGLEVTLTQNLQVLAVCKHVGRRDVQLLPFLLLLIFECNLVVRPEECDRVSTLDELCRPGVLVEGVVAVRVSVTLATLLVRLEDVGLRILHDRRRVHGGGRSELLEDVLRVEKLGIDMLGSEEVAAHDEDLRGDVARGGRLRRFDLGEELVEDPDEVVVVDGTEDLSHERAALDEELRGELEGHEHELGLAVCVLHPCGTDVGRTVMQDDVSLPVLQLVANQVATVGGGDVGSECNNTRDRFDWDQVDTYGLKG